MNKIMKKLKLLLVVCLGVTFVQAGVNSNINYSVTLPDSFDWGVYQLPNNQFQGPFQEKITTGGGGSCEGGCPAGPQKCCVYPGSGGLSNTASQNGSVSQFQISPCGTVYDYNSYNAKSGCVGPITVNRDYDSYSKGRLSFTSDYVSYSNNYTSKPAGHIGPWACDSLSFLLYPQLSPFLTPTNIQSVITQSAGGIDMSQYWVKDSSGNIQFLLLLDFTHESTPLAKNVGDF